MAAPPADPKPDQQASKDAEQSASKAADKSKNDKKKADEEELSEEDEKLKNELEMLVERLKVCCCYKSRTPPPANPCPRNPTQISTRPLSSH